MLGQPVFRRLFVKAFEEHSMGTILLFLQQREQIQCLGSLVFPPA